MGFKCPVCFEDFKYDKKAWKKHCAEKHAGNAKDLVNIVIKITTNKEEERF